MAIPTALMALLILGQDPTPPQEPETRTFTDAALGLSFAHPATWVTVPQAPGSGKKPKKDDGTVVFSIPSTTGGNPTELTIVRASFSGAPEKWQQIQADSNRNMKRDVERQWQQEILGVPLLLTRIGYVQEGIEKTTVTGLLYNAAPYKLLFRLTGPSASFDAAQYQFTQAMESLRTTNDALPSAQEPDKPIAAPNEGPDKRHTLFARQKIDPKAAPVALAVAVGGRKMLLRVPEGWTLEKEENDVAVLRHPEVKGAVSVKLFARSTAPQPTEALMTAANASLDEFKSVALREDTPGEPNRAGNPVLAIWRKGEGTSGPYAALDAVCVAGDYYLLFSARPTPGNALREERGKVQTMLDAVGLEPAP